MIYKKLSGTTDNSFLIGKGLTSVQRTALTDLQAGQIVYDTTTNTFWWWNGTIWKDSGSAATAPAATNAVLDWELLTNKTSTYESGGWVVIAEPSINPVVAGNFTFQAIMEVNAGRTGYIRLFNYTDGIEVAGTSMTSVSTVPELKTATLIAGTTVGFPITQKTYQLQFKADAGASAISQISCGFSLISNNALSVGGPITTGGVLYWELLTNKVSTYDTGWVTVSEPPIDPVIPGNYVFQAMLSADATRTASVQLYNLTDGVVVAGTSMTSVSATPELKQVTIVSGTTVGFPVTPKVYQLQVKADAGASAISQIYCGSSQLIKAAISGGPIPTDYAVDWELVTNKVYTYESGGWVVVAEPPINPVLPGNFTFRVLMDVSAGRTGYARLWNYTDAIEVAGTSVSSVSVTPELIQVPIVAGATAGFPLGAKKYQLQIKADALASPVSVINCGYSSISNGTIGCGPITNPRYTFYATGYYEVKTGIDVQQTGNGMTANRVVFMRQVAGTAGTTEIDLLVNGISMFTAANRPKILFSDGDSYVTMKVPNYPVIPLNARVELSILSIEDGDPQDITVQIF